VIEYVKKQWINKNVGWYERYAVGFPSTNNALEANNLLSKMKQLYGKENLWDHF